MAIPRSVRLGPELERKVEDSLSRNKLKFSQLISMAVEKFISEPQTIKLVPADTKEFLKSAKQSLNKHKDAMNKLK